jgi:hypothetical protein
MHRFKDKHLNAIAGVRQSTEGAASLQHFCTTNKTAWKVIKPCDT